MRCKDHQGDIQFQSIKASSKAQRNSSIIRFQAHVSQRHNILLFQEFRTRGHIVRSNWKSIFPIGIQFGWSNSRAITVYKFHCEANLRHLRRNKAAIRARSVITWSKIWHKSLYTSPFSLLLALLLSPPPVVPKLSMNEPKSCNLIYFFT